MKRLTDKLTLLTAMLLLTACSSRDDDGRDDPLLNGNRSVSINLAIVADEDNTTRATWWPAGGNGGNASEGAFPRENTVTGVTLILFKVPDEDLTILETKTDVELLCFNTTAATKPTLDLIRYIPITDEQILEGETQGSGTTVKGYRTGQVALGPNHKLDLSAKYYAVAICNCYPPDLANLKEGVSTIDDLKDLKINNIYMGDATQSADQCNHFVTALERYVILDFGRRATGVDFPEAMDDGGYYYDFTKFSETTIQTQRLAARIDFWAVNSNGYKEKQGDGTTSYNAPGYEYTVYDMSGTSETADRFVITHITPFNLSTDDEYLIKRCNYEHDGTTKDYYLGAEDGWPQHHVMDPHPTDKTGVTYLNPLSGLLTAYGSYQTFVGHNDYCHSVADMYATIKTDANDNTHSGGFTGYKEEYTTGTVEAGNLQHHVTGTGDVIIVGYATENTLWTDAPLLNYATGVAIEGDYYTGGTGTPEHRVYYGFLRHASNNLAPDAFDALRADEYTTASDFSSIVNTGGEGPMLFGVVRNNIYRIHINKVYQRGSLSLSIRVKHWDAFRHDTIYM